MSELLYLSAAIEIQAAAGESKRPRASIVAYRGGLMTVPGFGPVVVDLGNMTLPASLPVLTDHRNELTGVIGSGVPHIEGGRELHVEAVLADTPETTRVVALAKSGFEWSASIGAEPLETRFVRAGETVKVNGRTIEAPAGGFAYVTKSRLREISLTAIGSDVDAIVSIAASQRNQSMSADAADVSDQLNPDPLKAAWDQTGLTASERIMARWSAAEFTDPTVRARAEKAFHAGLSGKIDFITFENELLRAQLSDQRLQFIRAERPAAPMIRASGRPAGPVVLQAAILKHLGHEALAEKQLGAQTIQAAADLRCHSMLDILKAGLTLEGRDVPPSSHEIIRAAFSTLSLPGILSNVADKLMLDSYRAFPSVALQIAKRLSARNFKQHTGYKLSGDTMMEELGPAGELKHGTLAEAAYTYCVKTFGRIFGLTRQDIVNDDLGAFDELPRMLGRGAAVALEEAFWTLVLANTGSFFGAGNNNYIEGATTNLSIASLGQAAALMRKQVDPQGHPISVTPKFLVVPPELEAIADGLFTSTNVVVAVATGAGTDVLPESNPFRGKYQPLVVPHLSMTPSAATPRQPGTYSGPRPT